MALPEDLQRIQAMLNQANPATPALGAEDVRDLPLAQARNTVERYNAIQRELDAFLQTIQNIAAPQIQAANTAIDERYEDQLEGAVDAETQQAIRAQMEAEKAAQSQQIMNTARAAVDAQRAEAGQKSYEQIQAEEQSIDPQTLQAAQAKLTALRTGDPSRPSTQGLSSIESAERAMSEQRAQRAQRDLNVIQAMEAAEGNPDQMEQFISNVERISDPRLQNETVQMISRLGFAAPRPIQLNQGGSVQPTAQGAGGGFITMPDGTVRVYMPDGSTQTAESEAAAQSMLNEAGGEAAPQTPDRSQVKAQLGNTIAQEQARLAQFVAPETPETQTTRGGSEEDSISRVDRPETGLPLLDYYRRMGIGDVMQKGKSLFTGTSETEESRMQRQQEAASNASAALGLAETPLARLPEAGEAIGSSIGNMLFSQDQPAFRSVSEMERIQGKTFSDEERANMSRNLGIPIDEPEAAQSNGTMRNFFGSMFGAGMPMR